MTEIERLQNPSATATQPASRLDDLKGRTWVTRRGVKVDRIGSAWLIRRFIDPAARFGFVDPDNQKSSPNEIRFDMFEGEFTHRDERCTFEVLLDVAGITDRGLKAIAEVVHDLDLRDAKYQRPETSGIAAMINGIVLRYTDDLRRVEEGATLLDALYEQFRTVLP